MKPFYRMEDLEGLKTTDALPGEFPYLRGTKKDNNEWLVRQEIKVECPKEANAKALDILNKGVDSLSFHVKAKELNAEYIETLLKDICAECVELNFSTCQGHVVELAELLVAYFQKKDYDLTKLRGSINYDYFNKMLAKGKEKGDKSMAYTALYRKFRPLKFSDMVGQEAITKTLRNQITSGRVGHAYLLNGTRGTGKTTTAKILARAVNCLNPQDGEPCNECEICKAALSGSLTDIVEMDAASNNSVDDIRAIRDEVNFLPTLAKYRVYIIDEVHMLSTGAFNALLKTLEEPPAHVKFILATTEPQKLPATILSRCQRFDFKKISNDDISKRLEYVCKESNIEITKEALKIISVLADGAMRDALSILERCIQEGNDKIDENLVKDLVGIPKLTFIAQIMKAIAEYKVEDILKTIEDITNQGKELNNLLWEIIKYAKDMLVYKTGGKLEIYSQDELKQMDEISRQISKERLLQIIYALSELENNMKWSSQKTVLFEVEMIKLCSPQESVNTSGLEDITARLNNLENKINSGNIKVAVQQSTEPKQEKKFDKPVGKVHIEQVSNLNIEKLPFWNKIIEKLKQDRKMLLASNLLNTVATMLNDMTVGIVFQNGLTPFVKSIMEKPENIQELTRLVSIECGKEMRIKLLDCQDAILAQKAKQKNSEDTIKEELDIPINIIEE